PVIFAIGVALGLARSDKGTAGIAAMLGFLIMNATMNGLMIITDTLAEGSLAEEGHSMVLGIQRVETVMIGGMIIVVMTALFHKKYHKLSLPSYLSFFGGSRFVPIITAISAIILGVIMFFVWPTVQGWIFGVGGIVDKTGVIRSFFFGFILR